jgi:hypothetical protein
MAGMMCSRLAISSADHSKRDDAYVAAYCPSGSIDG